MSATMTEQDTPRVWIGCLACYNAGRLVGDWYDAAAAADVTVAQIHTGAGQYAESDLEAAGHEELWCFDTDCMPADGEMSPAEATRIAEALDRLSDYPAGAVAAYASNQGVSVADIDADDMADAYNGEWDSERDFAENFAGDIGAVNEEASWPHSCIDWERATRELFMDYWSAEAPGGMVYVFRCC